MEREHAGEIRLIGECQQVEHQRDLLLVCLGHAHWRVRHFGRRLRPQFGALDSPLDLTHIAEVLAEPVAVGRPQAVLQLPQIVRHEIEEAAVDAPAGRAIGGRAAAANRRSNTTRGLISIGSGVVSEPS